MDTQRYTRKVKTCEKDLAKAKENLDKWGATSSTHAVLQNGGTGSSSLTAHKEDPSSAIETPVDQVSSSITADASTNVNGAPETKQEKGESQTMFCFEQLFMSLTFMHTSC
jgi:hypothetical protein